MKADNPKLFKTFKWALYPEVIPGVPAKVTIGGIDLAVSAYSQHKALAFQAALCLRDRQNQIIGANVGGVPPTIASLYNDPALFKDYPFHADILKALEHASVRPKTPVYQVVSIDISHLISPPAGINPVSTEQVDGQPDQQRPAVEGPGPVSRRAQATGWPRGRKGPMSYQHPDGHRRRASRGAAGAQAAAAVGGRAGRAQARLAAVRPGGHRDDRGHRLPDRSTPSGCRCSATTWSSRRTSSSSG